MSPRTVIGPRARMRHQDDGAVAVEFALVLVPFLVVVFGAIQYGVYFWAVQGGSAAAREAARHAAVGQPEDCGDFVSEVEDSIEAMRGSDPVEITRTYEKADPADPVQVGDDVVVTVSFNSYEFNFPFLPFINGGKVNQAATARVEYVPSLTIGDC